MGQTVYHHNAAGQLLWLAEGTGGGINNIYLGKKLIAKDGFIPEDSGKQHYRPHGESIEGATDDVGYTGHKFDKDLGLSYMQARYYDPVIGRFYSNDPVDVMGHMERGNMVQGFGRYTYVNNNPYKYTDPDGEFFNLALGAIGATVGAISGGVSAYISSGGDTQATIAGAGIGLVVGASAGFTGGATLVGAGKAADISLKTASVGRALQVAGTTGVKTAAVSGVSNVAGQLAGNGGDLSEVSGTQAVLATAAGVLPGVVGGAILDTAGTAAVSSLGGMATATVASDVTNVITQVVASEIAEEIEKKE